MAKKPESKKTSLSDLAPATGVSKLICYQLNNNAPRMVPARSERDWMDSTRFRFAYRCLPLTIANSMGWELLCPRTITASWNGGPELEDIQVVPPMEAEKGGCAQSHFGHGVLTFQTHYLFRTEPGVALWVRGSPNLPKNGIVPLDGIVETDWLNFTFTMNWIFTKPGRVTFEKDEPFCFLTPIAYHGLDDVVPEIVPITADPALTTSYEEFSKLRREFNAGLAAGDPESLRKGWQKWYMRGEQPTGEVGNHSHISKLRLATPRVRESESESVIMKKKPD